MRNTRAFTYREVPDIGLVCFPDENIEVIKQKHFELIDLHGLDVWGVK